MSDPSQMLKVCGTRSRRFYLDPQTGFLYNTMGGSYRHTCAVRTLKFPKTYSKDDRPGARGLMATLKYMKQFVRTVDENFGKKDECKYRPDAGPEDPPEWRRHTHGPVPRFAILMFLFRWDCRLRAVEHKKRGKKDANEVLAEAIAQWPFVFPISTKDVAKLYGRYVQDFIKNLWAEPMNPIVARFVRNHTRPLLNKCLAHLKTKQRYWEDVELVAERSEDQESDESETDGSLALSIPSPSNVSRDSDKDKPLTKEAMDVDVDNGSESSSDQNSERKVVSESSLLNDKGMEQSRSRWTTKTLKTPVAVEEMKKTVFVPPEVKRQTARKSIKASMSLGKGQSRKSDNCSKIESEQHALSDLSAGIVLNVTPEELLETSKTTANPVITSEGRAKSDMVRVLAGQSQMSPIKTVGEDKDKESVSMEEEQRVDSVHSDHSGGESNNRNATLDMTDLSSVRGCNGTANDGPSLPEQIMDPLLNSGLVMEEMIANRFPGLPEGNPWDDVIKTHSIIEEAKVRILGAIVASKKLPLPQNQDFQAVFAKIVDTLCDAIKDGAILKEFPQIL